LRRSSNNGGASVAQLAGIIRSPHAGNDLQSRPKW
jgi:hypothetical protein